MASIQDLAQKVEILEDKLAFVMHCFKISRQEGLIDKKVVVRDMLDLYLMQKAQGMSPDQLKSALGALEHG